MKSMLDYFKKLYYAIINSDKERHRFNPRTGRYFKLPERVKTINERFGFDRFTYLVNYVSIFDKDSVESLNNERLLKSTIKKGPFNEPDMEIKRMKAVEKMKDRAILSNQQDTIDSVSREQMEKDRDNSKIIAKEILEKWN